MLSALCFTKRLHPQLFLCVYICMGTVPQQPPTLLFDTGPFTGLDLDEARLAGQQAQRSTCLHLTSERLGPTPKVKFLLELPQDELAH